MYLSIQASNVLITSLVMLHPQMIWTVTFVVL